MTASRDWTTAEASPAGSDFLNTGDDEIRATKVDIRQRGAVDHLWGDSVSTDGYHTNLHLKDSVTDPLQLAGYTMFYAKTVSGVIELFCRLADATVVQLTKNGLLNGASLTNLANTPSGAGIIPIANLVSGTPNGTKFIRDDGTLQVPVALIGEVVQVVYTQTGTSATGTTLIPTDGTIPQITEGDEYMSLVFTPKDVANLLKIDVVWNGVNTGIGYLCSALFKVGTSNALCVNAGSYTGDSSNKTQNDKFTFFMTAGTISDITFKVRAGGSSSGTTTFNNNTAQFGSVVFSSITVTEVKS